MSPPPPRLSRTAAEYDSFAEIYGLWADTAASAAELLPFYTQRYLATDGPIVELGIGDGRIAVEAAVQGCRVTGIDVSAEMLDLCRQRARQAGVEDQITLVQADFRNFQLTEPASLICLPYRSLGSLTTPQAKDQALRRVFTQLRSGGACIFDDHLITSERLSRMCKAQLRAAFRSPTGTATQLWARAMVDEPAQTLTIITWQDEFDADGMLEWRRYRRLHSSWQYPAQTRRQLKRTGFTIDACLGDFQGSPFSPDTATEQIWIVRKPA